MSAEPHGAAAMVPSGWGLSGAGIPPVSIFIMEKKKKITKTKALLNKVTQMIYRYKNISSMYLIKGNNAIQSGEIKLKTYWF